MVVESQKKRNGMTLSQIIIKLVAQFGERRLRTCVMRNVTGSSSFLIDTFYQ